MRFLQTLTQSRPHVNTSVAGGTAVQSTCRHVHCGWSRSAGHRQTPPLPIAPKSRAQTDTSRTNGTAVHARRRDVPHSWRHSPRHTPTRPIETAPQSRPQIITALLMALQYCLQNTFLSDSAAVNSIFRHVHCGYRRSPGHMPTRPLQKTPSPGNTDTFPTYGLIV
jgi:hypothetical protein